MSQNYKIVERLKAGRRNSNLGIIMGPTENEIQAASLIQELGEALEAVISATQAYLPPDGIDAKECISRVLQATDNQRINAILSKLKEA